MRLCFMSHKMETLLQINKPEDHTYRLHEFFQQNDFKNDLQMAQFTEIIKEIASAQLDTNETAKYIILA